jgi:hypothetical protein
MRIPLVVAFAALAGPLAYAATDGVVGEIEQSAATSPQQKLEFAASATAEIDDAVKAVDQMLEQLKKRGTSEGSEVDCLKAKATSLRTLQEVARAASTRMQGALASGDGHPDLEYNALVVARDKAREFLAEAQTCTTADDTSAGQTSSSVTDLGSDLVELDDVEELLDVPVDASPH